MKYIEPHGHMVSRTTDDYEKMALAGCEAICEPAFWAGFDRSSAQGFHDYFCQLTQYEPKRAAKFGIKHFSWICINPKESEDIGFAKEVLSIIPDFLEESNVLGIGEIGLNKNSRNELEVFELHVELAKKNDLPILIHTPHLEDKLKGTKLIIDALNNAQVDPERVVIDHVEEHTIGLVKDHGFWSGMTLYPESKCSLARAVDMLEVFGDDKTWLNSACDWGISDPLAVVKCGVELKRRRHAQKYIEQVLFENPRTFLEECPNFQL